MKNIKISLMHFTIVMLPTCSVRGIWNDLYVFTILSSFHYHCKLVKDQI